MIFFDIDGTLIDHKKAERIGVEKFYFRNGFNVMASIEEFQSLWLQFAQIYFGKYLTGEFSFEEQRIKRVENIYWHYSLKIEKDAAKSQFYEFLHEYENAISEFSDVKPALKMLKSERLGIISNGDMAQQCLKLKKAGIIDCFEVIVTAGDCGCAKPAKEIFEIACKKANVELQDSIYVGDELEVDVYGCENARMRGILIDRDNKFADDVCNNVIRDLRELERLLEVEYENNRSKGN